LAFIRKAKDLGKENPSIKFHSKALGTVQKTVLQKLGPVMTHWQFYLAGGTALALYFGHRLSVDLDWFTGKQIEDPFRLAQEIRDERISFKTTSIERGTLYGRVSEIRVSLLEYRYPLLRPLVHWPGSGCLMASLEDIACMKLSAVAQRGSKKDFVDIYALGLKHIPLKEMLQLYQKKYAVKDIAHVLYGLTYFDDAEQERMLEMFWNVDWKTIKKTIQGWIRDAVRSQTPKPISP
jgi:predicted nucleotidyltransferase component of viral defense system